jgi:hypothetical protein
VVVWWSTSTLKLDGSRLFTQPFDFRNKEKVQIITLKYSKNPDNPPSKKYADNPLNYVFVQFTPKVSYLSLFFI